ncbi:hypothetical protein BEWA_009720 [Theileria equi strain WA]|uniref:Uncharacterized protein n=1 Tax=Theileria equi strain WA TaxID=1537102 RepID=L0B234_THEEQ|nr:hypothetical protein BEWA_009720 [Theileria equi strain WA]AFZ81558.1 hypothetical protein BEWA_009720 [Theileria equi strain WA]|eukprot:XP_004831224.1 hypothetical protein BEWA_009720 [Theileria equi strain WA]
MSDAVALFKSIDDLLERILSLDFHKDLIQENHVDLQKLQRKIKWHLPLEPLPVIIPNIEKYHTSFFSLFMVECLESITQDKYDSMSMPHHALPVSGNIRGVFGNITLSLDLEEHEYLTGDLVCLCITKANLAITRKDNTQVKIESKHDKAQASPGAKLLHLLDRNGIVSTLGFVSSVKKNRIVVKILLYPPKFVTPETCSHKDLDRLSAIQQKFRTILNPKTPGHANSGSEHKSGTSEWYIAKLSSLTTILREFNALCMMKQMPLRNLLLKFEPMDNTCTQPNTCTKLLLNFKIPDALKRTLESKYNSGQLCAISNSLNQSGISLIQGPPGTGKTTTIIGIISVILYALTPISSKKNDYKKIVQSFDTFHIKHPWYFQDESDDVGGYFDDLRNEDYGYDYDRIYNIYDSLNSTQRKRCNNIKIDFKGKNTRRILICAPSNAAVDEIVKRLVATDGGIFDSNGNKYKPTVTRVGPNFHEDLIEYSLNTKVDKWFSKNDSLQIKDEKSMNFKRASIAKDILLNSEIVCSTLSGCGSKELYGLANCFDTLIIDEATQAVELSTLIPLNLGCKRAILVGDPCQLSATVCSKAAIQLNYEQSLFKRLQLCGYPVNFLKLQYRMDPQITRFPSMYFYKNQLINADESDSRRHLGWRMFPLLRPTVFYAIDSQESRSDTSYVNEMEVELVCQLLEIIIEILLSVPGMTQDEIKQKIAVISPYSAQVDILKSTIYERIKMFHNPPTLTPEESKATQIYISTVDGFQGMEKDIIIFSAVRTKYVGNRKAINAKIEDLTTPSILTIDKEPHDPKSLEQFQKLMESYLEKSKSNPPDLDSNVNDASFISDRRRINVAITRARNNLFIVGNPRYLLDHRHWYALYNHYAKTGALFICHTINNQLKRNFLKNWIVDYIKRAPAEYEEFLKDRQLKGFMEKLV